MAALYAKWIDAANAIQNPDADIRAIWDAHWLRSLVIADRTDKRQINLTTGEELIAASYNRAINDVNVYVLAEARAAGQREAKAMTEHFERVEQARIEQERAEQLRQAEQRQINTLAVIQAINNAQLQQQEAAAETARRAAMLEFGLRLLSPPQQAPIQFPQPQMCSSYVNGRYISTRCW